MSNLKTLLLTLFLIIITLYLIKVFNIAYPLTIVSTSKTTELAVVGEATIQVVPDTARINLGIITQGKNASEVREKIDQINSNFLSELKKLALKKEQIKTNNYSIYPNYDYSSGKITGYTGDLRLQIKVKDPYLVKKIKEKALAVGVNLIETVYFFVDNPEIYREKVREKAIDNAKNQAEKLAKNLGIKLGKITNVVEAPPEEQILFQKKINADSTGRMFEPGVGIISTVVTLYFEKK